MKTSVPVSGIWLRTGGVDHRYHNLKKLEVLAEVDGEWKLLFTEHVPPFEAEVSHIFEGGSIACAPSDPITEAPGVEVA